MGLIVLSLFDGISCGQVALNRNGEKVEKYYASEIDKHAIKVTQHNYPNTIQLGDVNNWHNWGINWENIDILFAGFPCQAWSFAGNQNGINDPRGALAIVLFNIYKHIKSVNKKFKFLFENVNMKKEYLNYLDILLGINSTQINSCLFSAQNRPRRYWTNIKINPLPISNDLCLCDIIEKHVDNKYDITTRFYSKKEGTLSYKKSRENIRSINQKSKTLICRGHNISNTGSTNIFINKNYIRIPTEIENERLQTLPDNYTDCGISRAQRYKTTGNGWTVDVICHILKGIGNIA